MSERDRLPLAVTTAHRADGRALARAKDVARRCDVPLLERESLASLRERAELIYVVGRTEEVIVAPEGRLIAGEGLLKLKRVDGASHPLIRAVVPEDAPARSVFDGTLGLAQDALHLSVIAGVEVDGVEASSALVCLVEDFLARARDRWGDAPCRVHPRVADAGEALRGCADDAYDVVYFDPMFDAAMPAQPEFKVLRRLAKDTPLDPFTLAEAVRVARQRVVLKVRTLGLPGVEPPSPGWNRRVAARAFNYWIVEKAQPNPKMDPLRVKYSHQKLRYLGLLE